jgi:hypothetical protein
MRESAMTHVEELHRELLQAPEHFATLFRASTSCIIQFDEARFALAHRLIFLYLG